MPVITKIKGKETIESTIEKYQGSAYERLQVNFAKVGIKEFPKEILLVAFKEEQQLLVYCKDVHGVKLIKAYPFTAFSGELGPKLKEGDLQIPEGIYKVEYLNPNSSYHLSIKVDYPNQFDISKSTLPNIKDMGGDIFIHGKSSSVGCIAIGDQAIEEVFLMTQQAIDSGVKVIISPRDFRVNSQYPQLPTIDWEHELYDLITDELSRL